MKLRNAQLARVDRRKVVDYLLNAAHPDNGGKASFFRALGFSATAPEALADRLKAIALAAEVVYRTESAHGEKYVVDGLLVGESEGEPGRLVRTVWIIERGQDEPRMVTAYPGEE
jgi:hypothetical protein